MKKQDVLSAREAARALYAKAHIALTPKESEDIEIADFGLNRLGEIGLELVTYVNTDRCCAKELALFPGQICPEHRHPTIDGVPGKEETFRCRYGEVYLYVNGEPTLARTVQPPCGDEQWYTAAHEIMLRPGEQYTLRPDTPHWFAAGQQGAVVSEFSTHSDDGTDVFTDPRIVRAPEERE